MNPFFFIVSTLNILWYVCVGVWWWGAVVWVYVTDSAFEMVENVVPLCGLAYNCMAVAE